MFNKEKIKKLSFSQNIKTKCKNIKKMKNKDI